MRLVSLDRVEVGVIGSELAAPDDELSELMPDWVCDRVEAVFGSLVVIEPAASPPFISDDCCSEAELLPEPLTEPLMPAEPAPEAEPEMAPEASDLAAPDSVPAA